MFQGLGCFLAWSIRAVQADHVSSERLTLSVFAVMVFSVSGVSGSLLTTHNPPLQFCLTSGIILCCNMFILSSVFGPKVSVTIAVFILCVFILTQQTVRPTRQVRIRTLTSITELNSESICPDVTSLPAPY